MNTTAEICCLDQASVAVENAMLECARNLESIGTDPQRARIWASMIVLCKSIACLSPLLGPRVLDDKQVKEVAAAAVSAIYEMQPTGN